MKWQLLILAGTLIVTTSALIVVSYRDPNGIPLDEASIPIPETLAPILELRNKEGQIEVIDAHNYYRLSYVAGWRECYANHVKNRKPIEADSEPQTEQCYGFQMKAKRDGYRACLEKIRASNLIVDNRKHE